MPLYRYTGRNAAKEIIQSEMRADSAEAVAQQLMGRDIIPIQIELDEKQKKTASLSWNVSLNSEWLAPWPTTDDLTLFCRQMYTLTKSGVPLVQTFRGLAETAGNHRLSQAMIEIVEHLQSGMDLVTAMSAHPKIFSKLFLNILKVGEETGRTDESFQQLYRYMEIEKETRRQIKSALRYPTFVMLAIVAAMFVINYFVIPAFSDLFDRYGSNLPWATQVLLTTSAFTKTYWAYLLAAMTAVIVGFLYAIQTEIGALWWDRIKLRLPLAGSIIHRATMARYARAFAMSFRSGVPLLQGLNIVSDAVDNGFVAQKILEMRSRVERGESLAEAAGASRLFTSLVLQMIAVGEETGSTGDMMEEVADFYEREVAHDVMNLSATIEPIMVTIIAGMVLVLALGIFLPMWEMSAAMTG